MHTELETSVRSRADRVTGALGRISPLSEEFMNDAIHLEEERKQLFDNIAFLEADLDAKKQMAKLKWEEIERLRAEAEVLKREM
jgi:hypothetical protein